ncbi:unnamed protein product [Diamesa serratosioi]
MIESANLSSLTLRSINRYGPQTPLIFKEQPPVYVLAQGPVFLNCLAVLDARDQNFLEDHSITNTNENQDGDLVDDETDEYEEEVLDSNQEDVEEIKKRYLEQLSNQLSQRISDSGDEEDDTNVSLFGRSRTKRNINRLGFIVYTWIRDGEHLLTTATDPSEDINGFKIFTNGTLKIKMTNQTAGSYRCAAKHSLYNIGAIISREAIVEEPDIVKVISTPLSVEAGEGGSVVLICPIKSQPAANFTCASGNPKPTIQWYKNGKLIVNSFVRHSKEGILRIESVEPEDEGIYQCFAGSVSMSNYLLVRKTSLSPSLKNVQCYPMDNNSILVTFDTVHGITVDLVSYFIATNSSWIAPAPISMEKNEKYFIFWNNLKVLSPFGLFMRGFSAQSSGDTFTMTRLSHGRDCSTQGLEPHFIKSPDGIFLWWSIDDESIHVTSFIIQLWYNEKIPDQQSEASCSFYQWSSQYMLWSDIGSTLKNTSIVTRSRPLESLTENVTIIELHLPGNATGILIPNTKQIKVRILGSVHADGELMASQQLKYLSWNIINSTSTKTRVQEGLIEVLQIESRSITITWTGFDKGLCLEVCYQQKAQFIDRGTVRNMICKQTLKDSTMFTVRNLQPQTWYDVFLKMCSTSQASSKVLTVGTTLDVPGPVIDVTGQDNKGIFIKWKPPRNPNGVIAHYTLEWRNLRVNHSLMMVNVSSCKFQFPNTLNGDRFNVTIRAIGVTGTIGNPHYLDLKKAMLNNPIRSNIEDEDGLELWNEQNMSFVFCVAILLLAIIGTIIFGIYWNHRQCQKNEDDSKNPGNVMTTNTGNGNLKSLVELHTLIQKNISDPPLVLMVPNYSVNSFYHLEEEETSEQISNESQRQLVIAAEEELEALSLTPEYHQNTYFEPIHPHLLTHPVSTNGCVIMSSFYPLDVTNNNNNINNNNNNISPDKENEENEQKNSLHAQNLSSITLHTDAIQHSWNFQSSYLEPNG